MSQGSLEWFIYYYLLCLFIIILFIIFLSLFLILDILNWLIFEFVDSSANSNILLWVLSEFFMSVIDYLASQFWLSFKK